MSCTQARASVEPTRAGGQGALLDLLAPDHEPRLQLYGHAAVAEPAVRRVGSQELQNAQPDR